MFKNFFSKVKEAALAVIPITAIVMLIHFTGILTLPNDMIYSLFVGVITLLIGMSFFTLGADTAIMPMGENIGEKLSLSRKLGFIFIVCFIIGFMITLAEPDVHVLAEQFRSIDKSLLILAIALGVGVYFVIAMAKIIFKIKLSYILAISYAIILAVAFIVPNSFIGVAFDAGGVTTGAVTVPFILAIGIGVASVRGGKSSQEDSFGLLGLCSIGPILAIMVLGLATGDTTFPPPVETQEITGFVNIVMNYFRSMPQYIIEVAVALLPVIVFYTIFAIVALKTTKKQNIRIVVGVIYTFVGVVIFLTGVNTGFLPLGNFLGEQFASMENNWILILLGVVIGLSIVIAEPSVQVLVKQVEEVTQGSIKRGTMLIFLSIGVAISIALCMLRLLVNFPILYILVPGYIIMVALSFITPQVFTAIAIDSGGIASGTITVAFVLPLAMGASEVLPNIDIMTGAFGVSGVVAMTPIIILQLLGLVYKLRLTRREKQLDAALAGADTLDDTDTEDIIEL